MEEFTLVYDYTPLIRLTDLTWPVYFAQVRTENPNTGFPYPCKDYILEEFGYSVVFDSDLPEGDVITETTPQQGSDGKFYRTYSVRPFTPEEKAQDLLNRKELQSVQLFEVFNNDRRQGVNVTIGSESYTFMMTADAINFLMLIKDIATSGSSTDTYLVNLKNGVTGPLSKNDTLTLVNAALNAIHDVLHSYLDVLQQSFAAVDKESLPAIPSTFIK